jgi:membrane protein DedA with SNARE-associated domain
MDLLLGKISFERVVELMDIGIAGYFVLFGLLFSCGLGMPLPEDIPLLVSGMLVGQHRMHVWAVAICAWCGIIGGDCVLYFLGHHFGLNITKVPLIGKHISKERILQAEHLFEKYGIWVVAVGRLFAGIRGAMVVAAGTIRFNFIKFIIADGLAALVSGGLFVWLGIKFGENLNYIEHQIKHYSTLVFIALVLVAIGFVVSIWLRKRRHTRSAAELAADAIEQVAEEHKLHLPIPKASDRHPAPPASDVPAK